MIEGIHIVRAARPGKPTRWYVYAWRGGPCIAKRTGGPRPTLTRDELKLLDEAISDASSPDPATLLALVRDWRPNSPEWTALAPGTKKTWGSQLDAIEAKWGKTPLALWSDARMVAKVVAWRDSRASTPRAADIGVTVLSALLEFGRLRGKVSVNVAARIPKLYKGGGRAEIIWTEEDITRFEAAAIELGRPWMIDGLRLAALTGLRRDDLVTLTWAQVGQFAIAKTARKISKGRRRRATMPRIPALDGLLAELRARARKPGVETVLVNSFGRPWSGDGFGGSFNRVRDKAGIVHIDEETGRTIKKHLHDLRGTFCTKLLTETDLTDREVADIMAWSPERVSNIRRVYVDQSKVIVAIGERIKHMAVKRPVKRSSGKAGNAL